jgi:hypothetical protein
MIIIENDICRSVSAVARMPGAASVPASLRAVCTVCACAGAAALAAAIAARVALRSGRPPASLTALASSMSRWCKLAPNEVNLMFYNYLGTY